MSLESGGEINVGQSFTCINGNSSYSSNTINIKNEGSIIVEGESEFYSENEFAYSKISIRVGYLPAKYEFNGNVDVSKSSDAFTNEVGFSVIDAGADGQFLFRKNLYFGLIAGTVDGLGLSTFIFDGNSPQVLTYDNEVLDTKIFNFEVGLMNSPTLLINGTYPADDIGGDLVIKNSSVLDLGSNQLNRKEEGGGMFLLDKGTLRLGGQISTPQGGVSKDMMNYSNFPARFNSYGLDSTSTVEFYGSGFDQRIPGVAELINSYGNLVLNSFSQANPNGQGIKMLLSNINIYRNLDVIQTEFHLGSKTVTLKSNNKTTANLRQVRGQIVDNTGQFIIERFMPVNKKWRYLATPISSINSPTVFNSWQISGAASSSQGTRITGPTGNYAVNGLDEYSPGWSMKFYEPATGGFTPITNTRTTPIYNKAGYFVYVRGSRNVAVSTPAPTSTTLSIKGQVVTGDQLFNIPIGNVSIGNPYPSRVDFSKVIKNNVTNAYYGWNPDLPGLYSVGGYELFVKQSGRFVSVLNSNYYKDYIESGEAFFVQNNGTIPGSIIFTETSKADGSRNYSRGNNDDSVSSIRVELKSRLANNEIYNADALVIRLSDSFSIEIDNEDIRKYTNSTENFYVKEGNNKLIIASRPEVKFTDTIFFGLTSTRQSDYSFAFHPFNLNIATGLQYILVDKFLNTKTILNSNQETDVAFTITADAGSKAEDRFMIVFKESTVVPVNFIFIRANKNANASATITWGTELESNLSHYVVEQSVDGRNFESIGRVVSGNTGLRATYNFIDTDLFNGNNFYRVYSVDVSGVKKYSEIVKINISALSVGLQIINNPVIGDYVEMEINSPGEYTVALFDVAGKELISIKNVKSNRRMKVDVSGLPAGTYVLVAMDKKKKYAKKFVRNK